jgi:ABC-type transporter Mla MlaB component
MENDDEDSKTISLGIQPTVEQIREMHKEIKEALKESDTVIIQSDSIEKADLSLIQLLYAARREAVKKKKRITFSEPLSPVLVGVLKDAGFIRWDVESAEALEEALIDF